MVKLVGVNEHGQRVGEDHPGAVLTNEQVDRIFELRDDEDGPGWTYNQIAGLLGCSKSLVRRIIKGEIRNQIPVRYKRV